MSITRSLIAFAALVTAVAVIAGPIPAAPSQARGAMQGSAGRTCADASWRVARSPSPGAGDNRLRGVTAVSATDAWAVGEFVDPASDQVRTLTQHWDGSAWTVVPSPVVRRMDMLAGVDASSSTDVWAVGTSHVQGSGEGSGRTLVEHWDGSAWRVVPSPNIGIEGGNGRLHGVLALTPDDVWAVGTHYPAVEFPTLQPLIEHWDGKTWQLVPGPRRSPGPWSELNAISGTGPSDIWAVGVHDVRVGNIFTERALILHWDGVRWRRVRAPVPSGRDPFALRDVVAVSPTNAWAVGGVADRHRTRTVVMHWDGRSWKLVPSANPSAQFQSLASVAAVSPKRLWAVGSYYDSEAEQLRTLVERWTGRRWQTVPSGNRRVGELKLVDIAAVRGAQFAVGSSGVRPERTLVMQRCRPSTPRTARFAPGHPRRKEAR
jgi:hypothetical protein